MLRRLGRAPLYVKLLAVVAAVFLSPLVILFAMASGGAAVAQKRPGRGPAFAVASWGFAVAFFSQVHRPWIIALIVLPFAVAWAASTGALARWYLPCRTTAWAMLWSLPTGVVLLRSWPRQPLIGVVAAILIAMAVVGWRLAKG